MNILMVTNTYLPIVGGLELSIQSFTEEYRKRGHRVMIVAPEFDNSPSEEHDVVRVPALKNFNRSPYSINYPLPIFFMKDLKGFEPDVVHAHHPFLMGDTALRLAYANDIPLIFTHHSLYEQNIRGTPATLGALKKFIIGLATGFANLCDAVIAPSESVAEMIRAHGVRTPVTVIPTGLHLEQFTGTSRNFKGEHRIPEKAFVVGYVGRLAEEKNLPFLMRAAAVFLKKEKSALFLVVGSGPMEEPISLHFKENGLEDRLRFTGEMKGKELIEAFQAIDVFAFASHSETQGMVLNEAMAAGTPVVGIDAPGVRDIVTDTVNGRLVPGEDEGEFARALGWVFDQPSSGRKALIEGAKLTARRYSVERSATKALGVYEGLRSDRGPGRGPAKKDPTSFQKNLTAEWDLLSNLTRSAVGAFR